jgi:hypothetical protein
MVDSGYPAAMKSEDRPVVLALAGVAVSVLILAMTEALCGRTGSDCPTLIKDYQAGLGALVGFTGVIIALVWNARQARIHADYQARLSREHADHLLDGERRRARDAFIADLTRITQVFEQRMTHLRRDDIGAAPMPAGATPMLYENFTDKLILLTGEEIAQVVNAYGHVRELPTTMVAFLEIMLGHPPEITGGRIIIPGELFPGALDQHQMALDGVHPAILALIAARTLAGPARNLV